MAKLVAEVCVWHKQGHMFIASKNFWMQSTDLKIECYSDLVMDEAVKTEQFRDIVLTKIPEGYVGKIHLDVNWDVVAGKQVNLIMEAHWVDWYNIIDSNRIIDDLI